MQFEIHQTKETGLILHTITPKAIMHKCPISSSIDRDCVSVDPKSQTLMSTEPIFGSTFTVKRTVEMLGTNKSVYIIAMWTAL